MEWDKECLPAHIGIIMDGNGRWAKKRGLPRKYGHREGAKTFRKIVDYAHRIGLSYLTVYAFSTENWKRPQEEINSIMNLMEQYLDEAFEHEEENRGIRTIFLGDLSPLSACLQEKIHRIQADSANEKDLTVNIALNYGGRDELVHAARKLASRVQEGKLLPEEITESLISDTLYTAGQPDPDLIIRPSGEERLSNFLIWQGAYAEFVFMNILWPDFSTKDLDQAMMQYQSRNRRFGAL